MAGSDIEPGQIVGTLAEKGKGSGMSKDKRTWYERAGYHRVWERRWRKRLLGELGGRCVFCGTTQDLTLDCIDPRPRHAVNANYRGRICFYRREMREGNVQILCRHCNSVKGPRRNYRPPFVKIKGRTCG